MRRPDGFFGVKGSCLHLRACETLVTISTDQGVYKKLVLSFKLRCTTASVIVRDQLRGGKDVILGHTEQLEMSIFPKQMNEVSEMRLHLTQLAEALAELYGLLEGYAPTWYTLHHHERAESALRSMKKL